MCVGGREEGGGEKGEGRRGRGEGGGEKGMKWKGKGKESEMRGEGREIQKRCTVDRQTKVYILPSLSYPG